MILVTWQICARTLVKKTDELLYDLNTFINITF